MNSNGDWLALARRFMLLLAVLAPSCASAGHVDGPYLLWFNLANDESAERAIHAYTNATDYHDSCWNDYAILQAHGMPEGVNAELVRRAVIRRQPDAQKTLRRLLQHPKGADVMPGYDGVIVVTATPTPTLLSFSTLGKLKSSRTVDATGKPSWEASFCKVLPETSRGV